MFSKEQWIFAGFFVVAFTIFLIISYRKDLKIHQKYYKGSFYVLLGFFLFVIFLFGLKEFLHP